MRGRWVAAGVATVLVAGGITAAVVVAAGCAGSVAAGALDPRGPQPTVVRESLAAEWDGRVLGGLAAAGLSPTPAWAVWYGLEDDTDVVDAVLTADEVLTVQQTGRRDRLVASYAADDGERRWQRTLPAGTGGTVTAAAGTVLVDSGSAVTAFDPASGEVRWCRSVEDSRQRTLREVPDGILLDDREYAGDSVVALLDPATGDERWSRTYSAHDAGVVPATTATTVSLFETAVDGELSGTRTLALDTGRALWSSTTDFPHPVAGTGSTLLLRSDAGLQGVDAATGRPLWTSPELDALLGTSGTLTPAAAHLLLLEDPPSLPADPPSADPRPQPGGLTAVDPATGAVRWRVTPAQLGLADYRTVKSVDPLGPLLVVHTTDALATVDATTGHLLARAPEDPPAQITGSRALTYGGHRLTVAHLTP